jgi:transcription elongation factor GreA
VTVFSPQAPLGAALLDAETGSVVEFTGPNGRTNKVEVVSAVPYSD